MYIKTAQTAVWVDHAANNAHKPAPRPARVQRWATRSLHTPQGIALALRFDGDYARVLLETNGRRRWVPLDRVMSQAQAERWIRTGFGRS